METLIHSRRDPKNLFAKQEKHRNALTQHPYEIPQKGSRVVILDNQREDANVHHIVLAHQLLWQLFREGVNSVYRHIWRQPGFGRGLGDVDVQAVELRGGREGASEVEEENADEGRIFSLAGGVGRGREG